MLELHLSDLQVYCLLRCCSYWRFDDTLGSGLWTVSSVPYTGCACVDTAVDSTETAIPSLCKPSEPENNAYILHFAFERKFPNLNYNFIKKCSKKFDWQLIRINAGNGLGPKRRQTIIWTNDGPALGPLDNFANWPRNPLLDLSQWGQEKMAVISQATFSSAFFLNENVRISIKVSLKLVPKGPINHTQHCSDNGSAPARWQVIILTKDS